MYKYRNIFELLKTMKHFFQFHGFKPDSVDLTVGSLKDGQFVKEGREQWNFYDKHIGFFQISSKIENKLDRK